MYINHNIFVNTTPLEIASPQPKDSLKDVFIKCEMVENEAGGSWKPCF